MAMTFDELRCAGVYEDEHGRERITFRLLGSDIRTTIRGVPFSGEDFDDLEPEDETSAVAAGFALSLCGALCSCRLTCELPIRVQTHGRVEEARVTMRLELGAPSSRGGIDAERLELVLGLSDGRELRSSGLSRWFEDELLELNGLLDEEEHLAACIRCAWSDYSPAGHGLFGDLACFRETKERYWAVQSKQAIFDLWRARAGYVPETHWCPDFELRRPGSGYRG